MNDYAEQDNYTIEKILAKRPSASAPGGVEFKVRWRGFGPFRETWEPVSSSVPRINTRLMEHVSKHKTKLQVSDLQALTRAIEAMGDRSPPWALPGVVRLSTSPSGRQYVPCLLALSGLWCNVVPVEWLKCCANRAAPDRVV